MDNSANWITEPSNEQLEEWMRNGIPYPDSPEGWKIIDAIISALLSARASAAQPAPEAPESRSRDGTDGGTAKENGNG